MLEGDITLFPTTSIWGFDYMEGSYPTLRYKLFMNFTNRLTLRRDNVLSIDF